MINGLTANIINAYNFFALFFISGNIADTKLQFFLLILNIVVYCFLYFRLYLFRFEKYSNK